MDLRGHGLSEKPRDAYGDPSAWAADIHAVVTELGMRAADPLRLVRYRRRRSGAPATSAATAIGRSAGSSSSGHSRLGEPVLPFLGEDFLATLPGMFSTDVETSTTALQRFLRLTTRAEPTPEDLYLALGYNMPCPNTSGRRC